MNKILTTFIIASAFSIIACNDADDKTVTADPSSKSIIDSLEKEVNEGHNVGMSKYGKLQGMQNKLKMMIDSIGNLPEKTKAGLASFNDSIRQVLVELDAAKNGMDKWMEEYNMDSALNNAELRIKYLSNERIKVESIKTGILQSLQKAESLVTHN